MSVTSLKDGSPSQRKDWVCLCGLKASMGHCLNHWRHRSDTCCHCIWSQLNHWERLLVMVSTAKPKCWVTPKMFWLHTALLNDWSDVDLHRFIVANPRKVLREIAEWHLLSVYHFLSSRLDFNSTSVMDTQHWAETSVKKTTTCSFICDADGKSVYSFKTKSGCRHLLCFIHMAFCSISYSLAELFGTLHVPHFLFVFKHGFTAWLQPCR